MTVAEYYRVPAVRERMLEYCGATTASDPTCVYLAGLAPSLGKRNGWDTACRVPPSGLHRLTIEGADISRSLWDTRHLIWFLELDYQNTDYPGEAYAHPTEVFLKLEPAYRATREILDELRFPLLFVMTGQGYHLVGRLPLENRLVDRLASLVSDVPPWFSSHRRRMPSWTAPPLDSRAARASAGLGLLIEFLGHLIVRRSAGCSPLPVVMNGTKVGRRSPVGRECLSVDLSHVGDPLDSRHMRVAFGAYQRHRFRPDIVGAELSGVPPLVALPRGDEPLCELLRRGRDTSAAASVAAHSRCELPDITRGLRTLLTRYQRSPLAAFHRDFYATTPHGPDEWVDTYDRLPLQRLLPCVAASLTSPNDLLLQPAHLQHMTRALMSDGWHPRHIAGLVHSKYAQDAGWGSHWESRHPLSRAEFDVRVFAGMIVTGLDEGVDFNCRSAQEKDLCPVGASCDHDLRVDRRRLLKRTAI